MLKRTGELVLSIIGLSVHGFMSFIALVFALQIHFLFGVGRNFAEADPLVTPEDLYAFDLVLGVLVPFTWFVTILQFLAIVPVAMALYWYRSKSKRAGIIFIVVGALSIIITVGLGMLYGGLYVAAGIMLLVRKPPLREDRPVENIYGADKRLREIEEEQMERKERFEEQEKTDERT
ncbi:DUF4064 domain-containing protein [Geomicrobium sp. JCM 19039]|uniref:DUF4064 domain-containing protein n=1 Tax=Geomicrobium sp. JCM 19039 TaxID=1460636 RepID=UPI00045F2A3C|nr:DUF4064 domain-containing protein [Geomicrobium sp. JCM 19039]GAK11585.1 hypothetical protein JCM19039_1290 [Geomicrobium sp. JCM 19039]